MTPLSFKRTAHKATQTDKLCCTCIIKTHRNTARNRNQKIRDESKKMVGGQLRNHITHQTEMIHAGSTGNMRQLLQNYLRRTKIHKSGKGSRSGLPVPVNP